MTLQVEKQIVSKNQVKLEIECILNKRLFQSKVINRETYEEVQEELFKEINKEKEKGEAVQSIKYFQLEPRLMRAKNYIIIKNK